MNHHEACCFISWDNEQQWSVGTIPSICCKVKLRRVMQRTTTLPLTCTKHWYVWLLEKGVLRALRMEIYTFPTLWYAANDCQNQRDTTHIKANNKLQVPVFDLQRENLLEPKRLPMAEMAHSRTKSLIMRIILSNVGQQIPAYCWYGSCLGISMSVPPKVEAHGTWEQMKERRLPRKRMRWHRRYNETSRCCRVARGDKASATEHEAVVFQHFLIYILIESLFTVSWVFRWPVLVALFGLLRETTT